MYITSTIYSQSVIVKPSQSIGAADIISVNTIEGIQSLNPSIMSEANGFNATASYTRPYNLTDLQQITGKMVYSTKYCNLTAQISKIGVSESNYTEIGGGLSRKFHNWGIGMEYHAIIHKLPFNQSYTSSFSRIGIHANPTKQWTISAMVHNIERRAIKYEYSTVELEPTAAIGIRWAATKIFAFVGEVQKGWDSDAIGKASVCIFPHPKVNASFGFSSLGSTISAGVGYTYNNIDIHIGISHHEQLGVSSAASVSIRNLWGD